MKIKGNEKDCICAKDKGKHQRYCNTFRLSEFFKKCVSIIDKKNKTMKKENNLDRKIEIEMLAERVKLLWGFLADLIPHKEMLKDVMDKTSECSFKLSEEKEMREELEEEEKLANAHLSI